MNQRRPPLPNAARAALTEELIARKGTDLERWAQVANLATEWDSRAELAAKLVGDQAGRVLDLGAGAMTLGRALPTGATYVPADVVSRSKDCLVVDLNAHEFPPGEYAVVVALGVLEYIHEPNWVLERAAEAAPKLVVSYCTRVVSDRAHRRNMGWVNDFTREELETLLSDTGWRSEACVLYKRGVENVQYLWKCGRRTVR